MIRNATAAKILRGVLSGAALTAVTAIVGVFNLRLVVHALDENIAGIWIVLLTLGNYLVFFDIGFGPTLSREIAFSDGKANLDEVRHREKSNLVATTRNTIFGISIVLLLIGGPLGWYLLSRSTVTIPSSELLQTWIIFIGGGLLAMNGSVAHSTLYGLGHVALERSIRVVSQLTWLLLTYVFLSHGLGLRGAALAWILQSLLARTAAFVILHREEPWIRLSGGKFQRELFRKMLSPSLKWAATTLGALLILQSGNLIVAAKVGLSSVAEYEALSKISMAVMTLGLLIATSSSPFLSRAHASHDRELFNSIFFRNLKLGASITVACVLFALFFGESMIEVWLGPGHFAGFGPLVFLMIMTTLEVHHVIFATAAMASGFVPFAPWAIGAGILNVGIGLVLAGPFGLLGMAIATCTAQILTNNWFAPYFAFKNLDLSWSRYLRTVMLPIAGFTAINVAALWLIRFFVMDLADASTGARLAIAFVLHGVSVLILSYVMLLSKDERMHLKWAR